jgi:hypothetical protein
MAVPRPGLHPARQARRLARHSREEAVMAKVHSSDATIAISTPGGHKNAIKFNYDGSPQIGEAVFKSPWINARAQMILHGKAGESAAGWKFGFIQLKFVSTDWAYYRGKHNADGSCFVALDRPPRAAPSALSRPKSRADEPLPFLRPGGNRASRRLWPAHAGVGRDDHSGIGHTRHRR